MPYLKKMTPKLFLTIFLVFAMGAPISMAIDATSRMHGAWRCNIEATKEYYAQNHAQEQAKLDGLFKGMPEDTTLTFDIPRKQLSVRMMGKSITDEFKIVSESGETTVVEVNGKKITFTLSKNAAGADLLIMAPQDMKKNKNLVFMR